MSYDESSSIPSVELDDRFNTILEDSQADDEQSIMMAEAVILVDEFDNELGYASKVESHHDHGLLHRAFSVLLFNDNNELLLQKRADSKVTFPGVWANSCCSHPLYSESEKEMTGNLGVKRAAVRKLKQELGIQSEQLPIDSFHFITKMMYSSRMDENWIEREIDHILMIKSNVDVDFNPNEVSAVKWVSREELEEMLVDEEIESEIAP